LCLECHANIAGTVANTRHAQAGVQCESCHGPAASHAANPDDPLARPSTDLTGAMCGKCHTGSRHPIYEEWKTSDHAEAVAADRTSSGCGRCHSEAVRLSLLKNEPVQGNTSIGIACVTCHDPHVSYVLTNVLSGIRYSSQLRNPLSSTNDYFMSPSDVFAKKYNAQINICAQCHNHRGAAWTVTDRAPHHSPQYNLLLGSVGELAGGAATFNPGSHAGLPESAYYSLSGTFYLTNQCVSCHMQNDDAPASTVPSHKFTMTKYDVCLNCHNFEPELLVQYVMVPAVSNRVYNLKYALDLWGSTKAPPPLQTAGVVPWEYTTPGGLIWQTNGAGRITGWVQADQVSFSGPSASNQALIPDNIKKARFNLYLVLNDGSYGVHNPYFALTLLDTAYYDWVIPELNP
jgi:hypothetical protein